MRQGPDYGMWIHRSRKNDSSYLLIPLELEHEFSKNTRVNWHDNGDGTYTLTPSKDT